MNTRRSDVTRSFGGLGTARPTTGDRFTRFADEVGRDLRIAPFGGHCSVSALIWGSDGALPSRRGVPTTPAAPAFARHDSVGWVLSPHPDPLPRGEGGGIPALRRVHHSDGTKSARPVHLLPTGEGRDEGGRGSKLHRRAFTLLELIVVLAVLALLSTTLLPTFCRSKANTKVTACAANMRQWALSVNLYAKDNKDWLPRFDTIGGGMYVWDVGTNLANALAPYGLTLQTWFCPVRPNEFDAANIWSLTHLGHPILTLQELTSYFGRTYAGELIINYNWWVPRAQGTTLFPTDYSTKLTIILPPWVRGSDPAIYGWPTRIDDRASARVPFMSDTCASGQGAGLVSPSVGTLVTNISPTTAHFFNGVLDGVNAAFVDGHVASRKPSQIRAVYTTASASTYWFY